MASLRRALAAAAALTLGLAGAVLVASPASAIERVVTNANDDGTPGTLRYEIENAGVFDTITFDPAFFNAGTPRTITLDGNPIGFGDIEIPTSLHIEGPGRDILTVTRGDDPNSYSIFNVVPAVDVSGIDIDLSGMTIDAGTTAAMGSAFQSLSTDVDFLTFTDVVFRDQKAQHGAGVNVQSSTGDLSFFGCEFRNNDAVTHGGGLYSLLVGGQIVLDSTLFYGNGADDGFGGGAAINPEDLEDPLPGNVSVQNGTRFELNNAEIQGGGAYVSGVNTVR